MKLSRLQTKANGVRLGVALAAAVAVVVALPGTAQAAATVVPLGTASSFVVLAGSAITNTGPTTLGGDVGLSPAGPSSITGFNTVTQSSGTVHAADGVALNAQNDLTIGYVNAAGQQPTTAIPTELGGSTLLPGVYSSGTFGITNTLTLDAQGDPNAVWVFKAGSTLITASNSSISLINGAQACNVFWQVSSSATLGTSSSFLGTVMALTSITLNTGATVDGRVLARNGAVTMDSNTITQSACSTGPSPSPSPSTSPSGGTTTPGGTTGGGTPGTTTGNNRARQVTRVPSGAVSTGDGSTAAGRSTTAYVVVGALAVAGIGGAAVVAVRRRRQDA